MRRGVGERGKDRSVDDVVINADFGHAMRTLFPESDLGKYRPAALKKRKYSCSTFMLYLGLDRTYPEAEHHMIVFARNYKKCLEDITKTKVISNDLSVYVRNAAPLDPSCAPRRPFRALHILRRCRTIPAASTGRNIKPPIASGFCDLLEERTCYKNLRSHIRRKSDRYSG